MKQHLFSLTKKDFEIQTFHSGGKGGQHQNTTDSGVRIIHKESGARGECRNHRSQLQNKKIAMQRLSNSKEFRIWINRKVQEIINEKTIEQTVNEEMKPENLKVEFRGKKGWEEFVDERVRENS